MTSVSTDRSSRAMAYSAAAMYAGAAFVGLVEQVVPGGPRFSVIPGFAALAFAGLLVAAGPRLSNWALAPLGPLGVVLIASALSSSHGIGDGAVLYIWPVLWTSHFYGREGAAFIVVWVGVAHGVAITSFPTSMSYFDRWIDVMVGVVVVALVVESLSRLNTQLVERLAAEARVDVLTGLLNRRGLYERLAGELERGRRDETSIAVIAFDLDRFKEVNDRWGHDVGDRVLASFGRVLRDQARANDLVARTGGEEFVALLPRCGVTEGRTFAERVRIEFSSHPEAGAPRVTASAGVAADDSPQTFDQLLIDADTGLYAAKHSGRDRTVVQPPSIPSAA